MRIFIGLSVAVVALSLAAGCSTPTADASETQPAANGLLLPAVQKVRPRAADPRPLPAVQKVREAAAKTESQNGAKPRPNPPTDVRPKPEKATPIEYIVLMP